MCAFPFGASRFIFPQKAQTKGGIMQGYIKLHRRLLQHPIFKNHKLLQTFIYCVLNASHKDREALIGDSIISLKSGQLATGRKAISAATGLSEQSVRTSISKLEKLSILTICPTAKYSIITIANWALYQQDNQLPTNCQPTANHKQECNKNEKNVKIEPNAPSVDNTPYQKIIDLYHSRLPEMSKVVKLTIARKSKIKARHRDDFKDLEGWENYFKNIVRDQPFLMGKCRPTPPRETPFIADLDFLINETNAVKICEGKYND